MIILPRRPGGARAGGRATQRLGLPGVLLLALLAACGGDPDTGGRDAGDGAWREAMTVRTFVVGQPAEVL
ncbi:MAG: hypothetical protein KGY49_05995, partial [Wenzhouxiangellaceae bacterium]|nr:hypothetical protein [Wenzhouxiangellaceae bacterium]